MAQRAAIVEFEVNTRGMWNPRFAKGDVRTVRGTLTLFDAAGYMCFWILHRTIIRASGTCWIPAYGRGVVWSNIVCAHEPPVIETFDAMAREGYEARGLRWRGQLSSGRGA